jgi:hypothetical protein
VLRRQVPPRDEAPSSWIGGLPMLPVNIDWPRARNSEYPDKGEIPLNFLAQIACSDLPHDLWGGFGPRDGWLVFLVQAGAAVVSRTPVPFAPITFPNLARSGSLPPTSSQSAIRPIAEATIPL